MSVGSLIGGFLMTKVGGPKTFEIFAIGAAVFCVLHIVVQYLMKTFGPHGKKSSRGEDNSETKSNEPLEVTKRDEMPEGH